MGFSTQCSDQYKRSALCNRDVYDLLLKDFWLFVQCSLSQLHNMENLYTRIEILTYYFLRVGNVFGILRHSYANVVPPIVCFQVLAKFYWAVLHQNWSSGRNFQAELICSIPHNKPVINSKNDLKENHMDIYVWNLSICKASKSFMAQTFGISTIVQEMFWSMVMTTVLSFGFPDTKVRGVSKGSHCLSWGRF